MNKKLVIVLAAVVFGIVGCSKEEEKVSPDIDFSAQQSADASTQVSSNGTLEPQSQNVVSAPPEQVQIQENDQATSSGSAVPAVQDMNTATTQATSNPSNTVANPQPIGSDSSQAASVEPSVTQPSPIAAQQQIPAATDNAPSASPQVVSSDASITKEQPTDNKGVEENVVNGN